MSFPLTCRPAGATFRGCTLLAQRFIDLQQEQSGDVINLSREALEQLCQCEWPGNIRELGNRRSA